MVQCIDHQCDVLAHVAVDVVRAAEQFRCLIDQVCCEDSADQSFFLSLVEFFHTVCEKSEGCSSVDTFCFTHLELACYIEDTVT